MNKDFKRQALPAAIKFSDTVMPNRQKACLFEMVFLRVEKRVEHAGAVNSGKKAEAKVEAEVTEEMSMAKR